jgi:type II secretory pathway pseudopilin PulG
LQDLRTRKICNRVFRFGAFKPSTTGCFGGVERLSLAVLLQPGWIAMLPASKKPEDGFTLVDLLVVGAVIGIISAIGLPMMLGATERMRLGQTAREVEREMQTAKQRSVARGRPIRVRFNCPAAGEYRMVELIGMVAAPAAEDNAADRCSAARYPYPAPDRDALTRPNLDGPVRRLDPTVTFGATETLEFWPDGTVHYAPAGELSNWPMVPPAGVAISVQRNGNTSTLMVNGLGRIQLQ